MTRQIVKPGSTIGVFGSGQLGRMFAMAAKRMGYRVVVFSPDADSPAGQVCDDEIVASYDDQESVEQFARRCDVITLEFENIPVQTVRWADAINPVFPGESVLKVAQDRIIEKGTLAEARLPVTPFRSVCSLEDLRAAIDQLGLPLVIKTARSGYDGKGQRVLRDAEQASDVMSELGERLIAEKLIEFQREVSILVFRGEDGSCGTFPLIENHHENHILDLSICPAPGDAALQDAARDIATQTAEHLDLVGLLCIELFVVDGSLMINEIAPRPHNSGHLTMEAFSCCQFQQLLRAICGLPFGETTQIRPSAMVNLLGDLWAEGEPRFDNALSIPDASLHLYGKAAVKPGRKMGHITVTSGTAGGAVENAQLARQALTAKSAGVSW